MKCFHVSAGDVSYANLLIQLATQGRSAMFPLSDDNSDIRSAPIVNYVLIALNVLVFFAFQQGGTNDKFTYAFATVPAEIRSGKDIVTDDKIIEDQRTGQRYKITGLQKTPGSVYLTLLTSMFMHGGIAHLLGNMWFLWIFGDNVEDKMGKVRYIIFYLLTGLIASLSHVLTNLSGPGSEIPSLGASGAISGVMGAYLALFPNRRVRVLFVRIITEVPGYIAVGLWFLFQLISGLGMLGGEEQGVAYAAHIGGFVAGVILGRPFVMGRDYTPPPDSKFRIIRTS
jgi:membrane associated rhomboid family serine protease